MEIKRKSIVKVNSKFTKWQDQLFLVLFNGGKGRNLQCVKIFLGSDHFRNDIMRIPPEYVGMQHMYGYVNGFDGLAFVWKDDIVEVVSELPDDIYNNIIRGIMLIFMGMYRIENIDKPDYKYLVIDKPISVTIDSSLLFTMIGNISIKDQKQDQIMPIEDEPATVKEEPVIVEEEPTVVEEEPTVIEKEPTTVKEEPKAIEEPKVVDIPEPKKNAKKHAVKKSTPVIKIGDKSYDEETILRIKQKYRDISDNDNKINYLYDLWSVNGRLPVCQIHTIIIRNKSCRNQKNTIALTKEEFIFMMREPCQIILKTKFSAYDGSPKMFKTVSMIQYVKTICKDLYFGNTEKFSKLCSTKRITESEKDTIKELIDEGKTKEEILTLFEECDVNKRRAAVSLINLYTNIAGGIVISKRLQSIKTYHGYDNDEELRNIINYFENNFEIVGLVASGIMPENFINCNHNKAIMVAIYINNPKNVSYIIMNKLGDYVRSEALDLYCHMIGRVKNRYIHAYIKCDKAKSNKRIRQETIYGFLKQNNTKKPYTDILNVEEQNFINLLNIDKRDYLEDRNFVLANMSKFDTWSKAMIKNRKLSIKEGI